MGGYALSVPMGVRDEDLVHVLAGLLPDILVNHFHYPRENAARLAPVIAKAMVMRMRECSQPALPKDAVQQLLLVTPTREQCEHIRTDLDEVIKINFVDPAAIHRHRPGLLRTVAGRLWSLIASDKILDEGAAASGPGVRG